MIGVRPRLADQWRSVALRFLPFADAATRELPLDRLLRLSLFQVSVGMALVLLNGTLNRVMIVELGVSAWLVALMVSLPIVFAPLRVLVGFRSDVHRSVLGWRRVPYIWVGTLLQFGGFAIMPFALLVLSGDTHGPLWIGHAASALAFLMVGAGLHTAQTAGLALATDLSPPESRPRVVALLHAMLLVGMVASALVFGRLLADFSQVRLVQVVQGAAVATLLLNLLALWKQEPRNPAATRPDRPRPRFREVWRGLLAVRRTQRFLLAVAVGTAGFSMQEVLLEPYGGQVMHLGVGATTLLTALIAGGALAALLLAARLLAAGFDACLLAAGGALIGAFAFSAVILASPLESLALFRAGAAAIGFGGGLFAVGTLSAAMDLDAGASHGLALGAWGAVNATAAGAAIAAGGTLRDLIGGLGASGALGPALSGPEAGYGFVFHVEVLLLFATLVVIGPLIRHGRGAGGRLPPRFGLAEFPNQ